MPGRSKRRGDARGAYVAAYGCKASAIGMRKRMSRTVRSGIDFRLRAPTFSGLQSTDPFKQPFFSHAIHHFHFRGLQDLCVRLPGAEGHQPRDPSAARSSRCSGPNGAGKTTLISIVCGIVNPTRGHGRRSTATTSSATTAPRARMIGLVPQELTTDAFETRLGDGQLQPRPVRQAGEPGLHREGAARPVAVGQEGRQDHDAVGRHEAPRDDRQGAVARAAASCSSTSRPPASTSSCAGTCGRWCAGCARRRHHHPDHALHRGGRGDGRPHRRHQQGRDHPGRGQGRADAQARPASS